MSNYRHAGEAVHPASAAATDPAGATGAFRGRLLPPATAALPRQPACPGRGGLTFVKPSAAYDLDLLCAAGCLAAVEAGIVTFEPPFGLAPHYRAAVERGDVRLREHA